MLVGTFIAVGVALRTRQLTAGMSANTDETAIGLNLAHRDFGHLTGLLDLNQGAPILWLWLQRAVVDVLGIGDTRLRLLSYVAGCLVLPVVWRVARAWLPSWAALIVLCAATLSPQLVRHGAEIKQYSSDVLVTLLIIDTARRVVERVRNDEAAPTRTLLVWSGASAVGMLASQPAILVAGASALVIAVALLRRKLRSAPLGLSLAVLFGPLLLSLVIDWIVSLHALSKSEALKSYWAANVAPQPFTVSSFLHWVPRNLAALGPTPLDLGPHRGAFVLASIGGLAALAVRRRGSAIPLLVVGAAVGAASVRTFPLGDRLALYLVPVLWIGVAELVHQAVEAVQMLCLRVAPTRAVRASRLGCAVAIAAVVTACAHVPNTAAHALSAPYTYEEVLPLLDDIARGQQPGDVTAVHWTSATIASWYDLQRKPDTTRAFRWETRTTPCDPNELRNNLSAFKRLWVIFAPPFGYDPQDSLALLEANLGSLGHLAERRDARGATLLLYDLGDGTPPATPLPTYEPDTCLAIERFA